MYIIKLNESGYEEAMHGLSLSYNATPDRAKIIAPKLAFGASGEAKFLESIYIWLEVKAPRFWWAEADTYRISTKQSESTMHTITKTPLTQLDFEGYVIESTIEKLNDYISSYNSATDVFLKREMFLQIKSNLPEGFLQRRVWVMNYKTLQNVYIQRQAHRLPQWHYFCEEVLKQIEHPEFIRKEY